MGGNAKRSESTKENPIKIIQDKINNLFPVEPNFIEDEVSTPNEEVYLFCSIDLCDSTALKREGAAWSNVMSAFYGTKDEMNSYLYFWKINGDEILYYRKIESIYQLAVIIDKIYKKLDNVRKLLCSKRNDDGSETVWEKVDLKTTVWLSNINGKDNFIIKTPYGKDFVGMQMDEGFRLTKLATKGKFVVDPQISLILCSIASTFSVDDSIAKLKSHFSLLSTSQYEKKKEKKSVVSNIDRFGLISKNLYLFFKNNNINPCEKIDDNYLYALHTITACAERLRLVGYSPCKGIWKGRNYPIIWYCGEISQITDDVEYDEVFLGQYVKKELLNREYEKVVDNKYSIRTFCLLELIYRDVVQYTTEVNKILRCCNLKFISEFDGENAAIFEPVKRPSGVYYIPVCYIKNTKGVLMLLRSKERGHLAGVWDFGVFKAQPGLELMENTNLYLGKKCLKNLGINIIAEQKSGHNSMAPFLLRPVYRRGSFNQGIVVKAEIIDSKSEEDIISTINESLLDWKSDDGYQLYQRAILIKKENFNDGKLHIDEMYIEELDYNLELYDSYSRDDMNYVSCDEKGFCTADTIYILKSLLD